MELILNNTQRIFQNNQMEEVAVDSLDRNTSMPEYVTNVTKFFSRNSTLSMNHNINYGSWINNGSIIPLYSIIFLLAVIGNSLVILTLVQNKRMRTITNIFLLNLALSDLCLGVFCLPFTLIGTLLRDFVFGEIFCKLLPYLQASSVSVSAWTLVAISVERYYAICHPLKSRRWQTIKHAYKMIAIIWCSSLLFMLPIAILSKLLPTTQGHSKCREVWPKTIEFEKYYNIILDFVLLVLPLLVLSATYSLITLSLWQGMRTERELKKHLSTINARKDESSANNLVEVYISSHGSPRSRCSSMYKSRQMNESSQSSSWHQLRNWSQESTLVKNDSVQKNPTLRRSNAEKSLLNKKRIIRMLFVVVLEFFCCWTPLYVINTIALFNPKWVYHNLGYTTISFCQLLAYTSSCCNFITYCFMSCGFRKAFLNLFHCCKRVHEPNRRISMGGCGTADANSLRRLQNSKKLLTNGTSLDNSMGCSKHSYNYMPKPNTNPTHNLQEDAFGVVK